MIVDASHRRWMWSTAAAGAASVAVFVIVRRNLIRWDAGGPVGIAFAIAASAIILFEIILGVRKSRPAWNLGRAATWARAHVWLGALALAFSLLHSGFHVRGTMSIALTILLGCVTASGLVGLVLQQIVPKWMTSRIPRETIYEQIPVVLRDLEKEADELVARADDAVLTRFYRDEVVGFLGPQARSHRLLEPERASRMFDQLQKRLRPELHEPLADLRDICDERAQLFLQERMQRWLHGWLLVHVPLSFALVIMVAAHAFMTLRY